MMIRVFIYFFFCYLSAEAQIEAQSKSVASRARGTIIVEEASVFKDPNFESEVIATLPLGQVYDISNGKKGDFYRIRYKPGMTGWISDAEVRSAKSSGLAPNKTQSQKAATREMNSKTTKKKSRTARKSVHRLRFRGASFEFVNYSEDTMGKLRTATLPFYGVRWAGPNTLVAGEMDFESEVMFSPKPPAYYEEATGLIASGFILRTDFMLLTNLPQTRDVTVFYGFGPMVKFSQINAQLYDAATSKPRNYALTDISIGAIVGAGVMVRPIDNWAFRLDAKYIWEAQRYTSLSLAILKEF
jgi:hypothetical protein